MNKNWIASGVAVLVVLLAGAWAFGFFENDYSDDPQVAELEKLRDKEFSAPNTMTDEQLKTAGDQLKKQAAGLNPEQKKTLWQSSMPIFMPLMMKRAELEMDKFLALSPEEQRRRMDERIDRAKGRRPGREGANRKKPTPAEASEFLKKLNDYTTPEQRAKFELVMGMFKARKEERGL